MVNYEVNDSAAPDKLIAGHELPLLTASVVIAQAQELTRGSVLGEIEYDITVEEGTENSGDGALVVSKANNPKIGDYALKCTNADVEGSEVFSVTDPDGNVLKEATVGEDGYSSSELELIITAGETGFAVNDTFTITVAAGSGEAKLCDVTSIDGSQIAKYVLPEAVDTTDTKLTVECYKTGIFNRDALIFGGEDTADNHEDELRDVGIQLRDSIPYN